MLTAEMMMTGGGGGGSASNAWEISGPTHVQTFSFSDAYSRGGIALADSGTRLYTIDNNSDNIRRYDLGTAWDISTVSSQQGAYTDSYLLGSPYSVDVTRSGGAISAIQYAGSYPDYALSYELSGANTYLIENAVGPYLTSITSYSNYAFAHNWRPDEKKWVVLDLVGKFLYQFNTAPDSAAYWGKTNWLSASGKSLSLSASIGSAYPHGCFWGGASNEKLYVVTDNRKVYQYDLSNADDISTGSYVTVFDASTWLTNYEKYDIEFSDDGTTMYLSEHDRIHQFSL